MMMTGTTPLAPILPGEVAEDHPETPITILMKAQRNLHVPKSLRIAVLDQDMKIEI